MQCRYTLTKITISASPKTNKLGNLIGKGKLHSYHTIKSLLEESHHDYDDEYAGGKSLAFLRLGRSSEEEHSTDEVLRKEIDDAIKSSGIQHKHNITKRSNSPDGEDDSEVDVDNPNTIDGKNNDEVTSGLSDIESEEELDEKEKEEYVPYEESATLSLPDFNSEEENSEAFDLNTSPYLSSHPDFTRLGKRNSFSLRPMKRNNFAFRPMKRNNFAFRPMKRNNFAFRPMKRNNFAFRPMKRNNFAFRPKKRNNFALRPMKRNNFAFRPMKRSGNSFALRPVKKQGNNFALRPMKRTSSPQSRKENFLRYGKRDSFALRPM